MELKRYTNSWQRVWKDIVYIHDSPRNGLVRTYTPADTHSILPVGVDTRVIIGLVRAGWSLKGILTVGKESGRISYKSMILPALALSHVAVY